MSQDAEILEKFIWYTINIKYKNTPPTEEEFMEEAVSLWHRSKVSQEEFNIMIKNLQSSLQVRMDVGVYISEEDADHQSWLPARRADLDFSYWSRYRKYLEDVKLWNPRVTTNLDTVSDEIVDLLGDPQNENRWLRRGLVLGDVQSGKTATYTAICNKAADTGYKVIIVMTGMMESLRQQTQERLDKEFAGRKSKNLLMKQRGRGQIHNEYAGVGEIDPTKAVMAFTTVLYDFNTTLLNSNDLKLKNASDPALFVVKKNKSVLNNLEVWLTSNNADAHGHIDLPLLLIDDEADNASVNTKKSDEDPTAINRAIRLLLKRFDRASYVGITATPFANIFINPETMDDMVGDDLFPNDFIYVLSPPSHYLGADAIFGDDATHESCLVRIKSEEIEELIPLNHKKELKVNALPPSLLEALGYFLLVNAIRDYRGDSKDHRSMLVNVSRFNDVQSSLWDQINNWLKNVQSDVRNYSALEDDFAMQNKSLRELKSIWDKYELGLKVKIPWRVLQRKYLHKAIAPIEVRTVNQKTRTASLDYNSHTEDGFRVIVVGGNGLSRGLTLEGLCVSYFYRRSQMYDTLLQMGRWFGYRPNYDDIFKVWMADEAIDWYGYILSAANELKDEIGRMNGLNLTPKDFGLKVRQDPKSLIVTARNKMRTATTVTRPISVSGQLLETPRLKSSPETMRSNERVFRQFVAHLDPDTCIITKLNGHLWTGIPKDLVVDLLRRFDSHPWHLSFQGNALADYIEKDRGFLTWDVFLPNGSSTKNYPLRGANEKEIIVKPARRKITEESGMIKISGKKVRVGSGGATAAGLTETEMIKAQESFLASHPNSNNIADSAYLIEGRKPLLMLHVLESIPDEEHQNRRIPDILFAIGIGFPKNDREMQTANYVVNLVELQNMVEIDDDGDDDDF